MQHEINNKNYNRINATYHTFLDDNVFNCYFNTLKSRNYTNVN